MQNAKPLSINRLVSDGHTTYELSYAQNALIKHYHAVNPEGSMCACMCSPNEREVDGEVHVSLFVNQFCFDYAQMLAKKVMPLQF